MSEKKEIGIIGLGKFGFPLARALSELGHSVVGVDNSTRFVSQAKDILAHVYKADATDETALEQIGFKDLDKVIVSTGDSMEVSILVILSLQSLGVKDICVKAVSEKHKLVLQKLGVTHVVFPEAFVALKLAHRLTNSGIHDYFRLGSGISTREIKIDKWDGKTLRDLDLTNKFQVQVIACKKNGETEFSFVPTANITFAKDDIVVLMGKTDDVLKVEKF
jgi:trk system potassium uptake protein TrkA